MTPGGLGACPGPGMLGALGRPPGWRRRGCRRPPRTWRTARSRRPASRRPPRAGPVRSPPRTAAAASTVYWSLAFAVRGRHTRAGTARAVPPGAAARPGWPRTTPARPRRGEGTPRRETYRFSGAGRKPAQRLEDVSVAGESVDQGTTGSHAPPEPAASYQAYDENRQPRAAC